jgi:hypothetical protein
MTRRARIVLSLLLLFIAIQFIQPARNIIEQPAMMTLTREYDVPLKLRNVLQRWCADCHSNNTHYAWYSNIQPFGWLLAYHVNDGKAQLNFNEFGNYPKRRKLSKLKSIENSIKDGSMPLSSYTLLHHDAKLSKEDKALIFEWTSKLIDSLSKQ